MMAPVKTQVTRESGRGEWMNATEVAELLGVTTSAVRKWAREGGLGHAKFGPQTMRFHRRVVEAFIEASCVTAGAGSR